MQWIKIKLCCTLSFVMGPFLAPKRELSAPWTAGRDGEHNSLLPKTNKVKEKVLENDELFDLLSCRSLFINCFTAFFLLPLLIFFFYPLVPFGECACSSVCPEALSTAAQSHFEILSPSSQPFQHKTKGRWDAFILTMPPRAACQGARKRCTLQMVHLEIQASAKKDTSGPTEFSSIWKPLKHGRLSPALLAFCPRG